MQVQKKSYFCGLMRPVTVHIDPGEIKLEPGVLLPLLGVPAEKDDPYTLQLTEACIDKCRSLMEPAGGYLRARAVPTGQKEAIAIHGTRFETGKIVGSKLFDATEFILFMGTAGPGPEQYSREQLEQGNYLEAFVADLVASAIAESVAIQIHHHVIDTAKSEGFLTTNRYSPGYCDWHVSEQQKLFGLFPPGYCGIILSDSSLMIPIKSISGVIGIGHEVSYQEYTCESCSMTGCAYRRTHTFNRRSL